MDATLPRDDPRNGMSREPGENFLATYRRLGQAPFKEALYGTA